MRANRLPHLFAILLALLLACSNKSGSGKIGDEPQLPADDPASASKPEKEPDAPVPTIDPDSTAECFALSPGLTAIEMDGQGSHGLARYQLRYDIGAKKVSGTSYKLEADGSTVTPVTVDRALREDELSAIGKAFDGHCVPAKPLEEDQDAAPGGYTFLRLEFDGRDHNEVYLVIGKAEYALMAPIARGKFASHVPKEKFSAMIDALPVQ